MDSYTAFASVYDEFMQDVPYDEWCSYVHELLKEFHIEDGLLCDLGCGTGSVTRRFQAMGYDMIGIDQAEEMLEIALEKDSKSLYLNQDMSELELYGTCRAFISLCDSMNYLFEDDFVSTLKKVNNYLDPEGIFIFDLKTREYFENFPDVFAESSEDASYIWENYYDLEESINEYDMTIFKRQENGLFERFIEQHVQKAYTIEEVETMINRAGMTCVRIITDNPERMYIIAKEKYQSGKLYK